MAEDNKRRRTRGRAPQTADAAAPSAKRTRDRDPETMLRGLVAPGPTALSPQAAMRARDVARPGAAEQARAERETVIVRRNYRPPAPGSGGS